MATLILNANATLAANVLDAVLVPTDTLNAESIIMAVSSSDPGVDVVGHTVDGLDSETVAPNEKLYVVLKNTTAGPVTLVVEVAVEDSVAPPPQ